MKNALVVRYPIQDRMSFLWLLIGTVLGMFGISIGNWIIPITAWLAPIFIIRFMRTQRRAWLAYLVLVVVSAVASHFALPPLLPMRTEILTGAAIVTSLIYLADRLLVPRLPGFAGTLVFPLAYTAAEFINTATNPVGSFGMTAYTQYDNLALLQLASVTGMWGIVFLMSWLASAVNWAWERAFDWPQTRLGITVYVGILALVLLFGQTRLWFAPSSTDTVRVAGITAVDFRSHQDEMMQALDQDREAFRRMMAARHAAYFEATIREAQAGAQIVVWPEFSAPVAAEDEAALIARGQEVARAEGIYLTLPMGVQFQNDAPYEQKMLLIDPDGEIVLEHFKYGGKGMEGNRVDGDGILRTATTPFGVLSGAICWDMDFPGSIIQSGRNGTDIMLSPSLEFREISPIHGHMAVLRGIENGTSVVRVADNGLSVISDPYGRILATMDHFTAGQKVITAQVPTRGVSTVYPIIGDLFGWLAIAGFIGMVVWSVVNRRRAPHVVPTGSGEPQPA